MSTRAERAFRAKRHILPIRVNVRQTDGRVVTQVVDADVREDKRARKGRKDPDELVCANCDSALKNEGTTGEGSAARAHLKCSNPECAMTWEIEPEHVSALARKNWS